MQHDVYALLKKGGKYSNLMISERFNISRQHANTVLLKVATLPGVKSQYLTENRESRVVTSKYYYFQAVEIVVVKKPRRNPITTWEKTKPKVIKP